MRRCLAALVVLALSGCHSGPPAVNITPEEVTPHVQEIAATATNFGLQAATKDQATYVTISGYTATAKDVINSTVLPLFTKQDLNSITAATAEEALKILGDKINPVISRVIQLAIDGGLVFLKLPANPADKLSDAQRNIIVSVFTGITAGIDQYAAWGGPATRDLAPPAAPVKLGWTKGGKK